MSARTHHQDIDALDRSIETVRIQYEKYFAGIERREPREDRMETQRLLSRMRSEVTHNTVRRFRLQQAQARWVTLEQYWNRVNRQIEEGTFPRLKKRLQRRKADEQSIAKKGAPLESKPAPSATGPTPLEQLHRELVKLRSKLGQTEPLTLDQLVATVTKQTAVIKARFQCRTVDFRVAVKDGRAILKAVPRR